MENELHFLNAALQRLMNREVKDWGYFKTAKDDDFSYLGIPALPVLKFYQNDKNLLYRAFWESGKETGELESIEYKTWNKEPSVSIKKKQRTVYTKGGRSGEKKQRIYEIICRQDDREAVRTIDRLLANFLKTRLESLVDYVTADEVAPQIIVMTE
jgi:hypothetical protein